MELKEGKKEEEGSWRKEEKKKLVLCCSLSVKVVMTSIERRSREETKPSGAVD